MALVCHGVLDGQLEGPCGASVQPGDDQPLSAHVHQRVCDVRLAVRDHGPGVPARHLGRIFEPFYRVEYELTRRRKGTGLGLTLVRGLAERMGARVTGRNAPGGGFEAEIVFPAAVA